MNQTTQAHTPWTSIALHLIPGALLTALYYAIAPAFMMAGYPALLPLLVCILVILIPVEMGILLYQGRKLNGRWSPQGVVLNRERIALWQYFVFVPLLLGWGAAAFLLLTRLDYFFLRTFFAWLPRWSMQSISPAGAAYPPGALLLTTVAAFLLNGIFGPVVEELYFRGYLLPRIPASRAWAPLINVVLFSLYHFFSPWQIVTRIVAVMPMVYVVAWKRNLYLSMITHCLLNILGMLSRLALAMR